MNHETPQKLIVRVHLAEYCEDNEMLLIPGSEYKDYRVSFYPVDGNIADQAVEVFMSNTPISKPEIYLFSVFNADGTEMEQDASPVDYGVAGTVKEA